MASKPNNIKTMNTKENKKKEAKAKGTPAAKRTGVGRPPVDENSKIYTFRAGGAVGNFLDIQPSKTDTIRRALQEAMLRDSVGSDKAVRALGDVYPATHAENGDVNYFDTEIVAGFPIPLDNDQRAERIEILSLLAPHIESTYLIRVKGNSMIEAGVHNGDIIIVDKSRRNPSRSEMAVCELNGEYTLKYFEKRGEEGWLVPANRAFPEIRVTEDDTFNIWGVVTYIIHKT